MRAPLPLDKADQSQRSVDDKRTQVISIIETTTCAQNALPAIARTDCQVCPLRTNLYPCTVRIYYNALVVAVAGTSRAIRNSVSVVAETLREFIDKTIRAY
jgi:hypothetical protein